jgi:hypothetical protein
LQFLTSNSFLLHFPTDNLFEIFHQNTVDLKDKTNELICLVLPELPHILCITENHLTEHELERILTDNIRAKFWWQTIQNGGVCIFFHNSLDFADNNVKNWQRAKYTSMCKLNLPTTSNCIISIYRSPAQNFICFLKGLDTILNTIQY